MGLMGRADRDVQQVAGFEADGGAVEFVIDGAFDHEQQLVTVGV